MSDEIKKTPAKPIERVTVSDTLRDKLAALTVQANDALRGIAAVTKSDVVGMILENHADHLSTEELEQLRSTHIDQVKLALWLANEMKEAKRAGESVTLKELLERCESALLPPKGRAAPRARKRKVGNTDCPSPATPLTESGKLSS